MNEELASNAEWQLRLFGKFSLASPTGTLVRLPDRKTEGVLAILALNRDYGMERQAIADVLWPLRAPKNLANLRRSLSILRRALGPDSIEGSVQHCRLSTRFKIVSDFDHPDLRGEGGFMPGHEGDWFDDARLDAEPFAEQPTAVSHFLEALRWFSQHDPQGMYALLSSSPSMGRSIPFADLSNLIGNPKGKEACLGWYSYWRGTVEDDLVVCVGHLRQALRIARQAGDLPLASEACLELGKVYARTGRLDRALKLCDIADVVAAKSKARAPVTNALRLRGTVLLHWHNPLAGLELLLRAEERIEDPIEFAHAQSARAFFEASLGLYEKAELTLAQSLATSRNMGHFRIGVVSAFTRTVLQASGGSRSDAVGQLLGQAKDDYASGCTQFGVYAEEFVAKLYLLDGDKGAAAHRMQSARKGRSSAQMTVTPLEAKRLSVVAAR